MHVEIAIGKTLTILHLQKQSDLGVRCLSIDLFSIQLVLEILEHQHLPQRLKGFISSEDIITYFYVKLLKIASEQHQQ